MVKNEVTPPADMQKTSAFLRTIETFHNLRDRARETAESWQERGLSERLHDGWNNTAQAVTSKTKNFFTHPEDVQCKYVPQKYGYVFRPKSRLEMILLSGTVCGIEFCYSAETAFVTPTLLSLGLSIKFVTMIWCLSPLTGLFLTPIFGSMSDSCKSKLGRRRPFIIMYSTAIILGLILVPNGRLIGLALGDKPFHSGLSTDYQEIILNGTSENALKLHHGNDTNRDDLNKFYSKDIDDETDIIHPTDEGLIGNKSFAFEPYAIKPNNFSATENTKGNYQNNDAAASENGTENTNVNKIQLPNSTGEFSDWVQKGVTFPEIYVSPENSSKFTLSLGTEKVPGSELITNEKETKLHRDYDPNSLPIADDTYTTNIQTWSVVFTVIGTILVDFCSDACQSPSRTYLLDVTIPSDHAAGLSTFTVMAGFGGSIGYAMGAVHWEKTYIGQLLGGPVNTVFLIVTVIFILCMVITVTSFPEIPLSVLRDPKMYKEYKEKIQSYLCPNGGVELELINNRPKRYGSMDEGRKVDKIENGLVNGTDTQKAEIQIKNESTNDLKSKENVIYENIPSDTKMAAAAISKELNKFNAYKNVHLVSFLRKSSMDGFTLKEKDFFANIPAGSDRTAIAIPEGTATDAADEPICASEHLTFKEYFISIFHMPRSLCILCLTNLFCWMSLVCYTLYFTDFVGECVFGGDPQAPEGSESFLSYRNGVQFGCWGMALYSMSCAVYSIFIESLIKKLGAKPVYIGGQLVYSVGMVIMAITRHKVAVILLSPTAGIMYSTLFTMPYLLIAHYHCNNQFSKGKKGGDNNARGIGTDVATVSSMVFLSQFVLSLSMGSIVEAIGSSVVTVCTAAFLSACGAISATQVTYLDI